MTLNLKAPELRELKPHIMVCGIGGAGGNAVNNMIVSGLIGVEFIVANTDAQVLTASKADRIIQMGLQVTEGLGAGSQPEVGRAAAEEAIEEIRDHLAGAHMVFVTAGMGGGTGTGAAPVIARTARDMGILTVGVVTKPFQFEGSRRMRVAEAGINELQKAVDTLIVIPNQNLFRIANEKTTFADAFAMADQVLYSGVACITDLMVKEGLINLDFADVRAIMREMGKAMMGTGEASGDKRAMLAAEAAIANPLLDEVSMKGARGLLISITGGNDLTLYEVDEAASRIRQEVDEDANIILGATYDSSLDGIVRVSVVATGIDQPAHTELSAAEARISEVASRLRAQTGPKPIEVATPRFQPAAADGYANSSQQSQYDEQAERAEQITAQAFTPSAPQTVVMQPVAPQTHHYTESQPAPLGNDHYEPGPFIPPQAESPYLRHQRMPQVEDLPLPGQRQILAQRGQAPVETQVEVKRKGLLERLASFGLSRQEEEVHHAPPSRPRPAAPHPGQAQRPQLPSPGQDYGRRPNPPQAPARAAQQSSQQQPVNAPVRPVYAPRSPEEDQLEIPAFLRRQSN